MRAMLTRSKRDVHDHAGSDHHVIKRAADDENQVSHFVDCNVQTSSLYDGLNLFLAELFYK